MDQSNSRWSSSWQKFGISNRIYILIFSVLSCILLSGLAVVCVERGLLFPFSWTADVGRTDYGIVIDAGSHGTRIHLFSWQGRIEDPDHPLDSPVTIPKTVFDLDDSTPALSDFGDSPSKVGPVVLAPLLSAVIDKLTSRRVPNDRWKNFPLFIKATAGMRNMEAAVRDSVMTSVRLFLANSTNCPFNSKDRWVRVISGEEEGVFAWMAVNNYLGTLLKQPNDTIGSIEMGGASVQVTFSPLHTSVLEDFYELNLGSKPLHLYSHSYIGFGWGDAITRLTTRLALESLFNKLTRGSNNLSTISSASDVIRGRVPGMKMSQGPNSTDEDGIPVAEFTAEHPCYAKGYTFDFDFPSLMYPDGRFFLDVEISAVILYLSSLGIPLDSPVISHNFPHKYLKPQTTQQQQTEETTNQLENDFSESLFTKRPMKSAKLEHGNIPFRPFTQPLPLGKVRYRVNFNGTSNFEECQARANELFYKEPCFLQTCSFNGIYQPRIDESRFYALGQFSKIKQALSLPENAAPDSLANAVARVCRLSASALKSNWKAGEYQPFGKKGVMLLCWKSLWAHSLLTTGLGFDGASRAVTMMTTGSYSDDHLNLPPIQTENPFGPSDDGTPEGPNDLPGWPIGSMIYEISNVQWENSRGRYLTPFIFALLSAISLSGLCCLLCKQIHHLHSELSKRGLSHSEYMRLDDA